MQYLSIAVSVASAIALVVICVHESPILKQKHEALVLGDDRLIDTEKDVTGAYYVVRPEGKEQNNVSRLPQRLKECIIDGDLQTGTNHIDATVCEEYDHAKRVLALQGYRAGESKMDERYKDTSLLPIRAETPPEVEVEPHVKSRASIQLEKRLQELGDGFFGIEHKEEKHCLIETILEECHLAVDSVDPEADLQKLADGMMDADNESTEESDIVTKASDYGEELAIGLPGFIPPEEPDKMNMSWCLQYHALEEECQTRRYEEAHNVASLNISHEQKAAMENQARIEKAIEDTHQEREDAEDAMQAALAAGDGEALLKALQMTKAVLAKLDGAPASITNMLVRLSKIGEGRYEQYYERNDRHASHERWLDRIKTGRAADWHMTAEELWQYVEAGNLAAVHAGLRAFLPVLGRSTDGQRLTLLHIACKPACIEAQRVATAAAIDATAAPSAESHQPGSVSSTATPKTISKLPPLPEEVQNSVEAGAEAGAGGKASTDAAHHRLPIVAEVLGVASGAEDVGGVALGGAQDTFSGVDDGLGVPVDEIYESVFEPDPAPVKTNDPDIGKGSTEGSAEISPEEVQERRMQIIKALLKAKASPNTLDGLDRTPLDLAVSEGGPGAEDLPIVKKMMELGLMRAKEAGERFWTEIEGKAQAASGSRLHGNTPKPKPKGRNPGG